MRKVLSVLLAAALVLSGLVMTASAAEDHDLLTASAATQNGTTVLTLTAGENTVSGTVSVDFDSELLTCGAVEVAGTLDSVVVTEGNVTFGYAAETENAIADGETVATITFTGEVEGYTAVDVTIVDFNDQTGLNERLPSVAVPQGALRFVDVPKGSWFYDAVEYTAQRGYFKGVEERIFQPNGTMTRAMFVTVLGRVAGVQPGEYGTTNFTDVRAKSYYAGYVAWAVAAGIVVGVTETEFAPNAPVSRQQAATFMYRYAKWAGYDVEVEDTVLATFADSQQVNKYARQAMAWATQTGVLIGYANYLTPLASTTRAQGAVMIQRLDLLLG